MKTLDDFIKDNREFFDSPEPSDGHMERFRMKLQRRFGTTTRKSIVPYLLKAAVVTLLITLSSLWTWEHFIRSDSGEMALGDVSPQFREVENYYVSQVNLMQKEISNIDMGNPAQKQMLMSEMKSMDSAYVQLQKDLKANPDDERIINAMIEHYQTKVEVMTFILNQLKSIQKENLNATENEKVNL
jgi:hypothetical protein